MAKRKRTKLPPLTADIPWSFESPDSSSIASATYDIDTGMLSVTFKTGNIYDCQLFPLDVWIDFERSTSKGQFFSTRIRPLFAMKLRQEAAQ